MIEELYCMERIIVIKTSLISFPGKIISTKEIDDIKVYFEEFERKVDSLLRAFLVEKENEAKSKKPKSLETKERFRIIEELFEEVKSTEKNIYAKGKFLFTEYLHRENEIHTQHIVPSKIQVILNDGRNINTSTKSNNNINNTSNINSNGNENPINVTEEITNEERLIIEHVFLNTKMSTNDAAILKAKATLDEEKLFISELFNLSELFPNCKSKQLIILDFYMNLYNLCIENNFTLQQISTIMSIYYYILSYSFGWFATENKISEIFNAILSYHSLNNPPFSYQIFNSNQKNLLKDFFNYTFIKNFPFFEVLFRYDISICFFNQVLKVESTTTDLNKSQKKMEKAVAGGEKTIQDYDLEEEDGDEKEMEEKKEGEKSQDEIEDEKEIEKVKNFVNSFYQAANYIEMQKTLAENNIVLGRNLEEANQAKLFLDLKVPEIKKDINEHVEVITRNTLKPVEQEMAERAATKGGKK